MNNRFGKILRKLRISRHLSQSELSRRSVDNVGNRISVFYINDIESGRRKLSSLKYLHLLARGLDISYRMLFKLSGISLDKSQRYLKEVGLRLQQIISKRHISSKQLAKQSFCHVASIKSWLTGNAQMSPYVLARISYVLDISPRQIDPKQANAAKDILAYPYFKYGMRLYSLRVKYGLIESQLARMLHVSQNQVSLLELGKVRCPLTTLIGLSHIFKVPLMYLKAAQYSLNNVIDTYSYGYQRMCLIRKLLGLNIYNVAHEAKRLGYSLSSSALSRAENGKRVFSLRMLIILSKVYEIPIHYLLLVNNYYLIRKQVHHQKTPGFNRRRI